MAYDEHGRMWQERPFWTQATYVVDRNLTGLSWEERKEVENASEYYGDLVRYIHYRSTNVEKTLWDERIAMISLKNEAAITAYGSVEAWERYAKVSVQVRYGDIRVSIIAGAVSYSTPRAYLPYLDQYKEWELAMFREPGRTLDALTGVISGAEKDALPPSEWICPCGAGLPFACEKLGWEHQETSVTCKGMVERMESTRVGVGIGVCGYVPVEDIAWLERQLAARRNMNVQIGSVKMIAAESRRWEQAEEDSVKLLAARVDAGTEKTDACDTEMDIEAWNMMQEDGERMARQNEETRARPEEA